MHIKLNPRIVFEATIAILLLLALYIERDLGFSAIVTEFFIKPVLKIILVIILLIRMREINPLSVVTRSKIIAPMLIGLCLLVAILFPKEIIFAREIIRFHLQRDWFNYVVLAAVRPTCEHAQEYGCRQWFDAPPASATVYTFEEGVAIDVESRQYIGFMHLVKQTGLPQRKSIGIWKFSCEYELGDGWYLCGGGT